jgi:hypothetical protein
MQIFHRSANVISRASIYAGIFTLAAVLWACIQFQRSPYVTYAGVVRPQPAPFSHQHHAGQLGIDPAKVRQLADGRLYSGQQAKAAGLVDELGGYTRAIEIAWERAGQTGEPRVRKVHGAWHPWWIDMIGEAVTSVRPGVGGGLLFLYGGATPQ